VRDHTARKREGGKFEVAKKKAAKKKKK